MTTVKNMKKKTAAFTSSNNAVSLLNQVLCYLCGIGRNVLYFPAWPLARDHAESE